MLSHLFLSFFFRHYHPSNIFSSMETIMTLVLEESEDISPEILTPLLATMKKDNKVNFDLGKTEVYFISFFL